MALYDSSKNLIAGRGGGGAGGGHVIEDSEGTDLTQRDTLQFGDGFLAEDDSTNEKSVVSLDVMQSGDMDDVITPLPSARAKYHKYSTDEQIVGEWIDGKPLYERTFSLTNVSFPATENSSVQYVIANENAYDIDVKRSAGYLSLTGQYGGVQFLPVISLDASTGMLYWNGEVRQKSVASSAKREVYLLIARHHGGNIPIDECKVTLQYTKTSD